MTGTQGWQRTCALLLFFVLPCAVHAHGSVVAEDDLCVINVGYLKAHFKIYVPQQTGHSEYCEDIPVRGESVFVMEYQHDGLAEAEVGFRIIRNVTGKGIFARQEDVAAIDDIAAVTVRYEPPAVVPDVYTLLQDFAEDGEYIGIVTANNTISGKSYSAVFPFEVGDTGTGVWPWIVAGLVILQLIYWFWGRTANTHTAALLAAALIVSGTVHAEGAGEAVSTKGKYVVTYQPSIAPIPVNTMHTWTLRIVRDDGSPVSNAAVGFDGGMPQHDHGLPTVPRATALADAGLFLVAGIRFHMHGSWEITIAIDDGAVRDIVVIPLHL